MTKREEALNAIERLEELLTGPDLNALGKKIALTSLDYARECVEAIQEVKRPRKVKGSGSMFDVLPLVASAPGTYAGISRASPSTVGQAPPAAPACPPQGEAEQVDAG